MIKKSLSIFIVFVILFSFSIFAKKLHIKIDLNKDLKSFKVEKGDVLGSIVLTKNNKILIVDNKMKGKNLNIIILDIDKIAKTNEIKPSEYNAYLTMPFKRLSKIAVNEDTSKIFIYCIYGSEFYKVEKKDNKYIVERIFKRQKGKEGFWPLSNFEPYFIDKDNVLLVGYFYDKEGKSNGENYLVKLNLNKDGFQAFEKIIALKDLIKGKDVLPLNSLKVLGDKVYYIEYNKAKNITYLDCFDLKNKQKRVITKFKDKKVINIDYNKKGIYAIIHTDGKKYSELYKISYKEGHKKELYKGMILSLTLTNNYFSFIEYTVDKKVNRFLYVFALDEYNSKKEVFKFVPELYGINDRYMIFLYKNRLFIIEI